MGVEGCWKGRWEGVVKYLILIYHNPESRAVWEGFSDGQRAEGLRYYAALTEELVASGEMIVTEALADPALGRRLPGAEGRSMVSDGPFAEAKEFLAGFFLVDCESMERAAEIAQRVPEA